MVKSTFFSSDETKPIFEKTKKLDVLGILLKEKENKKKGYLIDTVLYEQDIYKKIINKYYGK